MQNSRIAGDPGVQLRTPQTTRWKCQFYVFLAAKRGSAFALAAIPFHLLYHLYNGIAFGLGAGRHLWKKAGLVVELQRARRAPNQMEEFSCFER